MTTWGSRVLIYDDEDEAALKARFIQLSADFPAFNCYQVAQHVFAGLREPQMRADQAAQVWANDLDVLEAIRERQLRGPADLPSIERTAAEIIALAQSTTVQAKERIAAYKLYAEVRGFISKAGLGNEKPEPVDMSELAAMLPG